MAVANWAGDVRRKLHQQDDDEDAGGGEHEVLQPYVVLEAGSPAAGR